jgi:hypothetical protein
VRMLGNKERTQDLGSTIAERLGEKAATESIIQMDGCSDVNCTQHFQDGV